MSRLFHIMDAAPVNVEEFKPLFYEKGNNSPEGIINALPPVR
jgi:hypothetical protein